MSQKRRTRLRNLQRRRRIASSSFDSGPSNLDTEFEKIAFSIESELIEKGYLHPDSSVATFSNVKEKRVPRGTCQ
ncbi:MAG: hypothetical protein ACD_67C00039G0003 [uncultured bacterium]|nr:MAG: hypothetical protein ACD_67C00039G0003 [uncultured bacterium]